MASQRPPAWFRLSSMRAAAPAPAPAPPPPRPAPLIRPPAPPPAIVRPAIPFRPPPPPTQAQEPPPPPPSASLPPTAPPSPPPPPRSPVAAPSPAPTPVPPSSPAAAPKSPVPPPVPVVTPPPPPPPARSPLAPQPSPKRESVAAPKSPTPPPPPSSPVTKSTLTTSTNLQQSSPSQFLSPQRKMQSPSPSKSTSPALKPWSTAETANGKASVTPELSPKTVKPWENKPLSTPPSPLSLPPPQIKTLEREREREPRIEQKNVLVQDTIDKPMKTHNSHNKGKREVTAKDKGTSKKMSDSEDSGMRIITIAGENRGAVMEISSARKKNQQVGHTLNKNGAEEGKSNNKEKHTMQTTFLNSNVQGINNSIVFNSKCHHNDPGIHLSLLTKPRSKDY